MDKPRNRAWLLIFLALALVIIVISLPGSLSHTYDSDGKIISKELLEVPGQNPNINIYKLFYYSDHQKVEALLTVPKASGKYPLMLLLHGGAVLEDKDTSHFDFGCTPDNIKYQTAEVIGLSPCYRGYKESDGYLQGIAENTRDTENGIKTAMSIGSVKPGELYLLGTSMGGGVALRLASERQDVKAVVAVSPFVGFDEYIRWMDEHPNETSPEIVNDFRLQANYVKFKLKENPELKSDYSILDRIPDIQAPVLLLQGTADENVVWQTVQEFADDMKQAGKTVKLVLYPNGNHALEDSNQDQKDQEVMQWFQQYGLPKSFMIE